MSESPSEMSTETPRPRLRRAGLLRETFDLLILIGAIYALVNLTTVRFIVQGPSMQPNFYEGDFLIVSRINYLFGEPEYGDIAVFHYPSGPEKDYIKRIIGLPGDTVEIRDTLVYVNNRLLEEPYINEPCRPDRCPDKQWVLEADEYFVMGDNRNQSSDSRSQDVGKVKRKYLVGEVIFRYWPASPPNQSWDFAKFIKNWGVVVKIGYPH